MFEGTGRGAERDSELGIDERFGSDGAETVRLGHDIRFVLAAVGGGGIRIAQAVIRRHLPYLETVAINCDPKVQELEEFDRRICLGPENGAEPGTGGSPVIGGQRARSAEPVLQRLFEGSQFITIIASLGGGTGTGALPYVVEAAARSASALKIFVVKPFECEAERRALADRTLARLHFIDSLVEKQQDGTASVQVLDNAELARRERRLPVARLDDYWGEVVARLVERELIHPAEAVLSAERMRTLARLAPSVRPVPVAPSELGEADPILPRGPHLAPAVAEARPGSVELTLEVLPPTSPALPPP